MCNGDSKCSDCSKKSMSKYLRVLPPGFIRTKVTFNSADGIQVVGNNSVILFNLARILDNVVSMEWTNTDLWYQLVSQPAVVSIDQLPNPNFTTTGVSYFALIQSGNNFISRPFPPSLQPTKSYSQLTFRITDKDGNLISALTQWFIEIEFIQKISKNE